jgi:hypothetical protein
MRLASLSPTAPSAGNITLEVSLLKLDEKLPPIYASGSNVAASQNVIKTASAICARPFSDMSSCSCLSMTTGFFVVSQLGHGQ